MVKNQIYISLIYNTSKKMLILGVSTKPVSEIRKIWHLVFIKNACIHHLSAHKPFMHPGILSPRAFAKSSGDIQCPSCPSTPGNGWGIASLLFGVEITVLLSTLATSRGSVHVYQLKSKITLNSKRLHFSTFG